MSRPTKTTNFTGNMSKAKEYIVNLEETLKRLYAQFNSFIGFNSVQIGSTNDYCNINSSGTLTLAGNATVWQDLIVPLTTSRRGSNNLPDFDETNVGYLFPKNDTTEILYIINQLPHTWKIGSTIYPHVHWSQGNSSNVTYNMSYRWVDLAANTTAGFTTYAMGTTVAAYVTGSTMHQLSTNLAGISGSSITNLSSILVLKLFRNDNAYPGDALTYQFDIHYEIDSLGSNQELVK
jgi:hypothetical protein